MTLNEVGGLALLKLSARTGTGAVLSEQQVSDVINYVVLTDTKLASANGMVSVLQHKLHDAWEQYRANR